MSNREFQNLVLLVFFFGYNTYSYHVDRTLLKYSLQSTVLCVKFEKKYSARNFYHVAAVFITTTHHVGTVLTTKYYLVNPILFITSNSYSTKNRGQPSLGKKPSWTVILSHCCPLYMVEYSLLVFYFAWTKIKKIFRKTEQMVFPTVQYDKKLLFSLSTFAHTTLVIGPA